MFEPSLVGSVMVEAGHVPSRSQADVRAIDVSSLDKDLLDAVLRLVRLIDAPGDTRFLVPPGRQLAAGDALLEATREGLNGKRPLQSFVTQRQ